MKKETIEKIIANNRRTIAVHQILAIVNCLEEREKRTRKAIRSLINELDGEAFRVTGTARAEMLYDSALAVRKDTSISNTPGNDAYDPQDDSLDFRDRCPNT